MEIEEIIAKFGLRSDNWDGGFSSGEDPTCNVYCKCGKELFASDHHITVCPGCGFGYITEFVCYRIHKNMVKQLLSDKNDKFN